MRKGFTLIELLVVISIISLLSSIVLSSLSTARAKGRYAQVIEQMKQIELASEGYYSEYGSHAPDVNPGVAPAYVPTYLKTWPTPPCPGWTYDWENWIAINGFVGVNLRNSATAAQVSLCTDRSAVCSVSGIGSDIQTLSPKQIVCS